MARKYDAYKDSGASWIGDIPTHWNVNKLKWHLKRIEPRNPGDVQVLSLYRELGIVPKDSRDDNHNVTSEDTSNYKYVRPGDFVVNKMKAWQGSVAVSDYEGIVSPAYYVYHFIDDVYERRYFHYLMRGCYKEEFMRLSGGIRIGQWDLPGDSLNNILVLIPQKEEQIAIYRFLDACTAEIDMVISEAQKSIDEYKRWKDTIIFNALTKGIWPDDGYKESGIQGLEKISCDYDYTKIKYVAEIYGRIGFRGYTASDLVSEGEGAITLSPSNLIDGKMVYDKCSYISWEKYEESPEIMIYPGDVLMVKTGASYGKTSFVEEIPLESTINPQLVVFKNIKINSKYFSYFLQSDVIQRQVEGIVSGGTIPTMSQEKINNFYLFVPSIEKQDEIVQYLDEKCNLIYSMIKEKELLISDLEAYKKALIFETVTGKRKVV